MRLLFPLTLSLCCLNCADKPPEPAQPEQQSALSTQEQDQIRNFWQAYRRATRARNDGHWQQAIAAYEEALVFDPQHEGTLYFLGNALFEAGRYAESIQHWQRLLELYPNSSRAHIQLGALYSCGAPNAPFDLERAEREFLQALAINKEESGPVSKLGEVNLLRGDLDRALEYLSAASRTNERDITAHYLLGYILWKRGDTKASQHYFQQAAALSRGTPQSASASSEGATQHGKGPMLAAGAARKSLFAPYLATLAERDFSNPEQVERAGQQLDELLRGL